MTVYCADHSVSFHEESEGFEGQLFLKRIRLPRVVTNDGVLRHWRCWDFKPGLWIDVFSRDMLITGCIGEETTSYIRQQFGDDAGAEIDWQTLTAGPPPVNYIFAPDKLTFLCDMESPPPLLSSMQFILDYNINGRSVDISECSQKRKWSVGRHFLTGVDAAIGENQFVVGRTVDLFRWRFTLKEAHPHTAEYLKAKAAEQE